MNKQEKICELYYVEHKKQQEIANEVDASQQYVSKIVKNDCRYIAEKEARKQTNQSNRKVKQAQNKKEKRQEEIRQQEYLLYLQRCNSKEMSNHYLPSEKLLKWEKKLYERNN